ncbi:NOP2 [Enterospora canceri]|uniref:NOP2 n=1 Tax=Enterospora canceri TaxID=1081671 RepID=A0A1Y1S5D3_9MICR|nr:NOP2 [Enterospora canceri]
MLKRRKDVMGMLHHRKVELSALEWCEEGLVAFKSAVPLGATPEYLAGYYFVQGANSFLPVLNLQIEENQSVVDLCAAPGGKATHIGTLMNNTGVLYAVELCKDRTYALKGNLHRMGITNAIVINMDAMDVKVGKVDRVLLDAPCSGTGVISKDKWVKTNKSEKEVKKIQKEQKKLILHAFDMLKPNGIMVYSTCSFLVEENEMVVDYLLRNRKSAKIQEPDISIGKDGFMSFRGADFSNELKKAKRIYPHVHNMDGFFYCKIKKMA